MEATFEALGINAEYMKNLNALGINEPTGIQREVIPQALQGKDIVGQSATGTGKTLAYLLPLMNKIDSSKREIQAVILAPTHELVIQIHRQIEAIAEGLVVPVTSAVMIGNVNISRQIDKLKEKPHILVGSSGRILELIQKKKINAQNIKTIVIDEADKLLDDKNINNVKAVIKTTQRDRQLMLFSATIDTRTQDRAAALMNEPLVIRVAQEVKVAQTVEHVYFLTEQRDKIEVLRKLVRLLEVERALVFINKSDNIDITTAKLNYHGLKAAGLYGSSKKSNRQQALAEFRNGKVTLLVASDVAARGLDITGVEYVFNLDMPEDAEIYLHRVGRTGRAGSKGLAISIVAKHEQGLIGQYEKLLKIKISAKRMSHGKII